MTEKRCRRIDNRFFPWEKHWQHLNQLHTFFCAARDTHAPGLFWLDLSTGSCTDCCWRFSGVPLPRMLFFPSPFIVAALVVQSRSKPSSELISPEKFKLDSGPLTPPGFIEYIFSSFHMCRVLTASISLISSLKSNSVRCCLNLHLSVFETPKTKALFNSVQWTVRRLYLWSISWYSPAHPNYSLMLYSRLSKLKNNDCVVFACLLMNVSAFCFRSWMRHKRR